MNQRSVRERMNALILELEEYRKLSPRERKAGMDRLRERVDTELQDCGPALLELPGWEFKYLVGRIAQLLKEIGAVVLIIFPLIH